MNKLICTICFFLICHNVVGKINHSSVTNVVSKSGNEFWYMHDPFSELVHVRIAFRNAGSAYQTKEKAGVPVFYSYAVFCGCGEYSKVEFEKVCSDIFIRFSCNAEFDVISFGMTVPKIVLKEAVKLFSDLINRPTFDKIYVNEKHNYLLYKMQDYNADPTRYAFWVLIPSLIFKNHSYENGLYGSCENFAKLQIEDLKTYKRDFIDNAKAYCCIFGDVTLSEANDMVDVLLPNAKNRKIAKSNITDITPITFRDIKKYYLDNKQSLVIFIMKNQPINSEERAACCVLWRILGDNYSFKGKIMSILRSKYGLIYGGYADLVDFQHANYIFGELRTDKSKVKKTIDSVKRIISEIGVIGITEEEFLFAKRNIKGHLLVDLDTCGAMCSFYFAKQILGANVDILDSIVDKIDNVTLDDVNRVAKKLFTEDNLSIIVMGNGDI